MMRVSAEVVKTKWFSPDGVGLTHDHETDRVIVRMRDGSEFWCTFAEHSALLASADAKAVRADG